MGKIIPFPDLMGQMPHRADNWLRRPRECWTPLDEVEEARAKLSDLRDRVFSDDPNDYDDPIKAIADIVALGMWEKLLIERNTAATNTALNYKGKVYAEPAGRA
ncbi:hypothetical protein [Sphingopyxis sp.]|uniref:hypothetical protein n=1 Tax=Sphingopyxis sp. TaxID=1908224 RepID=UPI0035AE70BC